MKNKLTALALSVMLCSGSTITPVVMAQSKTLAANVPTLKSAISQNTTQVELTLGKAQVIHLSTPASRVSISDPEAVGIVLISPTEVELIGKKIGVANLLVWGENSGQNYLSIDLSVHRDVSTLANKIQMIDPGINILPVAAEDSVILTGVAESIEKAQLAYDLAKAFFAGGDKEGAAAPAAEGEAAGVNSNSPGSSTLAASTTKILNLIRVMGQPSTKAEMVQERLKDIDPNITLNVVPGFGGKEKAILTGRVKNASAVSKAVNLASVFYGTPGLKVLAGPGGNVVREGKEGDAGGGFTAGTSGSLIGNLAGNILHGSIMTDTSGNVISMLEVNERPQIKCSIKFLEVRKNNGKLFNASTRGMSNDIRTSTYAGRHGQVLDSNGNAVLLTDVNNFFYQVNGNSLSEVAIRYGYDFATLLSGLITKGEARILAEPTVTSISGEPASFLAGGEFPIPIINSTGGTSILFKEFGIRLNLLATVTDRGTIHMQVSPEVSSLDLSAGINVNGFLIPGLRARRSQTVLEMKSGDNFVMSGLYNENMTDVLSKTPLLGQIPILGNLFRSKEYQQDETEMIIVIHPEIQEHMNLSNLENPTSQVKQIARLNQDDLFKGVQPPKAQMETRAAQTQTQQPQADARQALADTSEKPQKAVLKEIKKTQKKMKKLSDKVVRGNTKAPNKVSQASVPTSATPTNPPSGEKVSAEKLPVAYMAQAQPLPNTASIETFLASQKTELEALIGRLQQAEQENAVQPQKITAIDGPAKQPLPSAAVKTIPAPAPKSVTPAPKPTASKAKTKASSATTSSPAKVKATATPAAKAQVSQKPSAPKMLAQKPVKATQPALSKQSKQALRQSVGKLQQHIAQLLSFNGF